MKLHRSPFKLREIKIEVTHRCNLYCFHCSSECSPYSNISMNRGDCLRILNEAIQMGVQEVAFSGGEPLLWPHLEDAIIVAKEGRMRVSIYTSGNVSNTNHKALNDKILMWTAVFIVYSPLFKTRMTELRENREVSLPH